MVLKVAFLLSCVVLAMANVSSHVSFNGQGHSSHQPRGGHATLHRHAPKHHAPKHHTPVHHAPKHHAVPKHHTPKPTYHTPAPIYRTSAPSYHTPAPAYNTPAPTYHTPAPSYKTPAPSYHAPAPSYHKPTYEKKAHPYDYAYAVKDDYTGNDFGHQETSNGDGAVTGVYRVLLPDGRTQVVTYTADHYNGYQATVSYEGEAQYPVHKASYHTPAPSYQAPAPSYH